MTNTDSPLLTASKIRVERLDDGALWRVSLASPKGNVVDAAMTAELTELFRSAAAAKELRAVVLTADGPHFSFGASVEEHRKEQVRSMLEGFHGLFRQMADSGIPVIAAVRGCCLGGGLELAAFCQRIFAHPEASFGQPEIVLGVFAPVGSAILPDRIGRGAADDLLLSGRTVKANEALAMRLVDALADDPEEAALAWAREHLLPRSASSLRFATRASRLRFVEEFTETIDALERLYLDHLMETKDANEGIGAFLEKRKAEWSHA